MNLVEFLHVNTLKWDTSTFEHEERLQILLAEIIFACGPRHVAGRDYVRDYRPFLAWAAAAWSGHLLDKLVEIKDVLRWR